MLAFIGVCCDQCFRVAGDECKIKRQSECYMDEIQFVTDYECVIRVY